VNDRRRTSRHGNDALIILVPVVKQCCLAVLAMLLSVLTVG
jgi:hypothetical protein